MITEEEFFQLLDKIDDLNMNVISLENKIDELNANLENRIEDLGYTISDLQDEIEDHLEVYGSNSNIGHLEISNKTAAEDRISEIEKRKNKIISVRVYKKIADKQFSNELYKGYILPDTLEEIGRAVFNECRNLEYIEIPSSVKRIAGQFCKNCKKLKSVKFLGPCPENMIGAFSGCDSLTEILVPEAFVDQFRNAIELHAKIIKPF